MTAPRTPSPLDGALLVDRGRRLLGLYQSLCHPDWLELIAPQATTALDDPMQNLERLLARFTTAAWEAQQEGQTTGEDEQPGPNRDSLPLPVSREAGQPATLRAPTFRRGESFPKTTYPATPPPHVTASLQPPLRAAPSLPLDWATSQAGYDLPQQVEAGNRPIRRSFVSSEEESGFDQPGEATAHDRPDTSLIGIAPDAIAAATLHPFPQIPGNPVPPPSPSGQGEVGQAASTTPRHNSSPGVVRLVTAPGGLSSLLQASLRPEVAPDETSLGRLNEPSTNQSSRTSLAQYPFNPLSKSVESSVASRPHGLEPPLDSFFPPGDLDVAQLERLVDEQFIHWLEQLELAYLRTYGTSGG